MTTPESLFSQTTATGELFERYSALVEAEPGLRRRDQADKLAVSEAALVDQQCGYHQSAPETRVQSDDRAAAGTGLHHDPDP